jgi:hypothetical protein
MQEFLKVKGHPNLVRQTKSNAILNTDFSSLNKYKEIREDKLKLDRIVNEQDALKQDIAEIKNLLQALLGQNK